MSKFEKELYDQLLEKKLISEKKLVKAESESKKSNVSLPRYLIDTEMIDEEKLLALMASIINVPFVNLKKSTIEEEAVKAVPVRFVWHYEFMPIKLEGRKLTIAVNYPLNIRVQDEIRLSLGYEIFMVLARREHILELLKAHYGLASDTVDKMVSQKDKEFTDALTVPAHGIEDIEKMVEDASVVKLVNQILLEAYKKRATDIHIEPFRGKVKLRYRIDGVLYDQNVPEDFSRFVLPILSRIKIMANLDIVEHRLPQDGRAIVKTQDEVLDLRVSFIPTAHGESVVIRILPTKMFLSLEKLGLLQKDLSTIESLIDKPNGIIFVTGPTGSGKTTTLYACLKKMNKNETKIITVEDPVEYEMEGTTQIQVNPEIGLTFAKGLRSMLRHDPDVMMVGEVRDKETAEIAIRVALTGHLVFSTLHTNDAASGVTRLLDIGIEPYLVASSVEAFVAQRLVRVICPHCKMEDTEVDVEIKKDIANSLELGFEEGVKVYKGTGCEKCNFTGFYGRTAIYEILVVDNSIKKLIIDKATAIEVKRQALRNGMKTLLQDGWLKVIKGTTTPQEVLHVCQDSGIEWGAADTEKEEQKDETQSADQEPRVESHFPGEKRIHMRIPQKITVRFRLVEKAEGEILKLSYEEKDVEYDTVFSQGLFRDVSGEEVSKELYNDVFTTTLNISAGGLAFASRYSIPVGSILELKIYLPGDEQEIQCLARVVRVEKDLPKFFYMAVCYLDMSGVDRSRINDFVKREIAKQKIVNLDIF